MLKFSIIIPVYNSELHLKNCLDSVLHQSYTNWECICVNDGSTDNSASIINDYVIQDKRFKSFSIPNQGVSNARNVGISMSTGEWILFIDSDDSIETNALDEFTHVIRKHPDVSLLYFGVSKEYYKENRILAAKNNTPFRKMQLSISGMGDYMRYLIAYTDFESACSRVFSRNIIEENHIRFNTRMIIFEDLVFNCEYLLKLNHSSNIYFLNKAFYHYKCKWGEWGTERRSRKNFVQDIVILVEVLIRFFNYFFIPLQDKSEVYRYIAEKISVPLFSIRKCSLKDRIAIYREFKNSILTNHTDIIQHSSSPLAKLLFWTVKHKMYYITHFVSKIKGY